MGTMIEVDLIGTDGTIQSAAAVDLDFWKANGPGLTQAARNAGGDLYVPGNGTDPIQPGVASRNIYALGDAQNWMATMSGEMADFGRGGGGGHGGGHGTRVLGGLGGIYANCYEEECLRGVVPMSSRFAGKFGSFDGDPFGTDVQIPAVVGPGGVTLLPAHTITVPDPAGAAAAAAPPPKPEGFFAKIFHKIFHK